MSMIEIHAEKRHYEKSIDIYITDYPHPMRGNEPQRLFASSLNWESIGDNQIQYPTLKLSETHAQQLIDQLWACGLRPIEAAGSAGSLAATQAHLQDMRRLVFEKDRP